jgi:hypothetical protein
MTSPKMDALSDRHLQLVDTEDAADSYAPMDKAAGSQHRKRKPDASFEIEGDKVLIKPGDYDVAFLGYHTWMMFGRRAKICLRFRIVTMGDHFEAEVEKHYNAKKLRMPIGKNGGFKVGFTSKFLRDFVRLLGAVSRGRSDRIPMTRFENNIFRVRVESVKTNNEQEPIPESMQYSVIRDLLQVVEGKNVNVNLLRALTPIPVPVPIPAPIPIPSKNGAGS